MRKKTIGLIILFLSITLIVACSNNSGDTNSGDISKEELNINFCYRDGIPGLTAVKLIKDNPTIDENITIDYEMLASPDLLVSKVLKEEADIAIVPSNLAAQAYNKGLNYEIVGTSNWGTLYLLSTEDINTISELKDKEIYAFGKGLTPDLILRYVLSENGLVPDEDVKINYLNAASDLGPAFLSGKTNLALLSEPLATNIMMKDEEAKIVLDLNEEWKNLTGADKGYPQASLIIKTDLIENHGKFVEEFISIYEESIKWAKENPEELGEYAEEMDMGIKKEPLIKGMERINIGNFPIENSQKEYNDYFNLLLEFAPDSIGGKLPDEKIFYRK